MTTQNCVDKDCSYERELIQKNITFSSSAEEGLVLETVSVPDVDDPNDMRYFSGIFGYVLVRSALAGSLLSVLEGEDTRIFCIIAGLDPVLECDGDADDEADGASADTNRSYPLTPQTRLTSVALGITFVVDGFDSRSFQGNICWCDLPPEIEGDVTVEEAEVLEVLFPFTVEPLPNLANFNGNFCLTCRLPCCAAFCSLVALNKLEGRRFDVEVGVWFRRTESVRRLQVPSLGDVVDGIDVVVDDETGSDCNGNGILCSKVEFEGDPEGGKGADGDINNGAFASITTP